MAKTPKKPQYRGLSPKPENFGVVPLTEGEGTKVYRVRAPLPVLERFGGMTAEERGTFLVRAYALLDATPDS